MGISALRAWTNGTVSFRVRVYQGEMQIIDEVHVNELVYSWADGSDESATLLVGEDKCWSINVGVLNLGDTVYVEVKGNTESGYPARVVEISSRYSITIPLIIAGCFLILVIGILVILSRARMRLFCF
jgi:hypothetical protein